MNSEKKELKFPKCLNIEEIETLLEEELENGIYDNSKFRIKGDTLFLTYFTNLKWEEIKTQFEAKFKTKKKEINITEFHFGRGLTKKGNLHIHILLKLSKVIDHRSPVFFHLLDVQNVKSLDGFTKGHYERCRDKAAALDNLSFLLFLKNFVSKELKNKKSYQ